VHDQLAVVGLAVETDVVDIDPSQPPRLDGTTCRQLAPKNETARNDRD
jgi:hypothetical protein